MRLQHSLASVLCFSKLRWKSIPRSRESVQFACWILNRAVYRFAKCAQVTLVNCTFMRGEPSRIKSSPDSWGSAGPERFCTDNGFICDLILSVPSANRAIQPAKNILISEMDTGENRSEELNNKAQRA